MQHFNRFIMPQITHHLITIRMNLIQKTTDPFISDIFFFKLQAFNLFGFIFYRYNILLSIVNRDYFVPKPIKPSVFECVD